MFFPFHLLRRAHFWADSTSGFQPYFFFQFLEKNFSDFFFLKIFSLTFDQCRFFHIFFKIISAPACYAASSAVMLFERLKRLT